MCSDDENAYFVKGAGQLSVPIKLLQTIDLQRGVINLIFLETPTHDQLSLLF